MRKIVGITTFSMMLVLLVVPAIAYAQTAYTIADDVGSSVGLGTSDLKTTTLNIISWVLGILALVSVAMIIFSGFVAATANGEERGEKAKKVVLGAVIGLVIVLISWAIVIFVAGSTKNVTS